MIADVAGLIASLILLAVAGDQFVIGLARLARAVRIRPTVVGAVIGGIGTSVPELIVAGLATGRDEPQIAMGSVVGSIVANVCLGLALAALVAPIRVDSRAVRREAPLSTAAVLLLLVLSDGGLGTAKGVVFAAAAVAALVLLLANARVAPARDELAVEVKDFFEGGRRHSMGTETIRTVVSGGVMVGGASLLVGSATALATRLGVAKSLIGLTLVAVGTSTPLVASSIQAARRGDHDIVVGDLLGGNLFIALGGGAIVGLVAGRAPVHVGLAPLWLMAGVVTAAWLFMGRGARVSRAEALVLLAAYAAALPFVVR